MIERLVPSGVGSYRGRLLPESRFALVACARRDVDQLNWVSLDELLPFVRTL